MDISVIIPAYNEIENIEKLYEKISITFSNMHMEYEIIFIDDGSTDGTAHKIQKLIGDDDHVRGVILKRNYGQTAALSAGLNYSSGKIIIPMDADLQNDPEDIPRLINKLHEGYDLVSGWRKNRKDKWLRSFLSELANKWISFRTGVNLHDYGCTLKAYKREIIENVKLYGEHHRFIPIYASWEGAKIAELVVNHHPRIHGASKYGMSRIPKVLFDVELINFQEAYGQKPIHIFGLVAGVSTMFGLIVLAFHVVRWILYAGELLSPLLIIGFSASVMGVQMFFLGILAEIIVRTYYESQGKKTYAVQELLGSDINDRKNN